MIGISVVIPAYNAAAFLRQAIDSISAQTVQPQEIIVVNDGSTDDTEAICLSYGDKVRYIYQANLGVSEARNTGVAAASGEWIALLDADDVMLPGRFAKQTEMIEQRPELVVVYSAFTYLYGNGTQAFSAVFPAKDLWPALRYRTPILPSTSMVKKSAILEVGGFRYKVAEDWDIWFRLVNRFSAAAFQESPESFTLYRRLDSSLSANYLKMADQTFQLLDDMLLDGLSGVRKSIWKRRIESRFYHNLSISMREKQNPRYWEYAIESLLKWPLCGPVVPRIRYKVFAHMLYTRLRAFRFSYRYWWPERACRDVLS